MQAAQELGIGKRRILAAIHGVGSGICTEHLPGIGMKWNDEDLLGLAMMVPARRGARPAGKAAGQAQRSPVRCPVAGASEPRDVDEGLGQVYRVAMHLLHVGRKPPEAECQHPGGKVAGTVPAQEDIAGVIGHQMQAGELLLGRPADPAVAHPDLEGTDLPVDQRQPAIIMDGDMVQRLAEETAPGQVVMLPDQCIPACLLVHAVYEADLDLGERNVGIGRGCGHDGRPHSIITSGWPAELWHRCRKAGKMAARMAGRGRNTCQKAELRLLDGLGSRWGRWCRSRHR